MGELIAKEQNLAKKEALGNYVHDMVDMEVRAFSLKKNMEDCRKEADEAEKKAKRDLEKARRDKESAEKAARETVKLKYNGLIDSLITNIIATILVLGIPGGFGGWFLGIILSGVIGKLTGEEDLNVILRNNCIIGMIVFVVMILVTIGVCMGLADYKKDVERTKERNEKIQKEVKEVIKRYIETEKKTGETMVYVQKLRFHANDLERDLAELHQNLQKNYALNVIPPDYRRWECLLWIDYAFRNDQVDTMREATLECDKHVMHGETMTALQELAASIRSVAVLLENMNNRISAMNANLFQIAQTQDSLLSETESARYAMESVSRSNEKLAYYEDLKRQGAFYL